MSTITFTKYKIKPKRQKEHNYKLVHPAMQRHLDTNE